MHTPSSMSALVLVNSANRRLGTDALADLAGAQEFLAYPALTTHEWTVLRRVRARMSEVFTEAANAHHQRALSALNHLLMMHATRPHFTGAPARLSVAANTGGYVLDWLSQAVVGLALVVDQRGLGCLGVCAALGCQQCFIDTSPRGDRRYCSRQCAARTDTARHRARRSVSA